MDHWRLDQEEIACLIMIRARKTKARKQSAQDYDYQLLERARKAIRQGEKLIEQTRELIAQSARLKKDFSLSNR